MSVSDYDFMGIAGNYRAQGLAQGLERASATLANMSLKRNQIKQDDARFDMDMKIKSLELKKLEGQMDTEIFNAQKDLLKNEMKMRKAFSDNMMTEIGLGEKQVSSAKTALESELGNEVNYAKGKADMMKLSGGMNINPNYLVTGKGDMFTKPAKTTVRERILGKIETGGMKSLTANEKELLPFLKNDSSVGNTFSGGYTKTVEEPIAGNNTDISEDDIKYTMDKYNLSREEVLERIGK